MDDEQISDRFWFEHESGRRLYPQRQRNQQTGRALFRVGKGKGANKVANQLELDDIEEVHRRVFQDGWLVRMRAEDGWNGMYGKDGPSMVRTSEGAAPKPTATNYKDVLTGLSVSSKARDFLAAHYYAPDHQASMEELAAAVGYDTFAPVNLHYGALAHKVADALPVSPPDVPDARYANWMQALAFSYGERNADGHFLWTLRPEVAVALESLGWVAQDTDVQADWEGGSDVPAGGTTRQSIVEARRGQGPFRNRVLQYWGGRCAVTGCALTGVLVASHIKPWSVSSDAERLDGFNGLLLTPNLDKLFDNHLVSFGDEGNLLAVPGLSLAEADALGLRPQMRIERLHDRHKAYLRIHRGRCEATAGVPLEPLAVAGNI